MMTAFMTATDPSETAERRVPRSILLPSRFDVHEVTRFVAAVDSALAVAPSVRIDASRVVYMDRGGMDALIEARFRCIDRGGDLTLVPRAQRPA